MTPVPGESLLSCLEARISEDAQRDFEDFLRFSASPNDKKFKVEYTATDVDVLKQRAFLDRIASLVDVCADDLDTVVIDDETTGDHYLRKLDIGGVYLLETAMVDEHGIVQGVSYEAEYPMPSEEQVRATGSVALTPTAMLDPSVAA